MSDEQDIAKATVLTPYGRLSFPNLAQPRAFKKNDTPMYGCTILFPKPEFVKKIREDEEPFSPWGDVAKHDLKLVRELHAARVADEWPNEKKRPKLNNPFKDGDDEKWGGYIGNTFIRMKTKFEPTLIDTRKNEIPADKIEDILYAGCWVRAIVGTYTYNDTGNIGVGFGLQLVQFVRDDEVFSGRTVDLEALEDLPDEDLAPDDLDDLG